MNEFAFFNVWTTESAEARQALIDAMRAEAPALAARDGFVSLTVWGGQAGDYRVIVDGRWQSREAFEAAVSQNPAAMESRARLERHGKSLPGMFERCLHVTGRSERPAPPPASADA